MKEIPLNAVEKQSLSVLIDNVLFELSFKLCNGIMAATVVRDGITIVENRRVVAGVSIIPQGDREAGNFIVLTNNDDLPIFSEFNSTNVLLYANEEETEALRIQLNEIVLRKEVVSTAEPKPAVKQPVITKQPISLTVDELKPAVMIVTATDALSYQWWRDSDIIPGANQATFSLDSATRDDAGNYTVVVTGEKYSSAVRSAPAKLTVTPMPAPSFVVQPKGMFAPATGPYAGKKVALGGGAGTVELTGASASSNPTYQWEFFDTNKNLWVEVAGQVSANFKADNVSPGRYRVRATNTSGSAVSEEVIVIDAYLFVQNDSATTTGSAFSIKQLSLNEYSMVNPSVNPTAWPLGVFIREKGTTTNITGIAVSGPTAVSSAPSVVAIGSISGRQVKVQVLASGKSDVTVSYGSLTSVVHIEVP